MVFDHGISSPSMLMFLVGWCLLASLRVKRQVSDLAGLILMCHLLKYRAKMLAARCNLTTTMDVLFDWAVAAVSSANWYISTSRGHGKSEVKTLESSGNHTAPCGTPATIGCGCEVLLPTRIKKVQSARKNFTSFRS